MTGTRSKPTPAAVDNRPGLDEVATRVGTHSMFLEAMQRGLADANRPGLADLRTRAAGDPTLAMLDGWAAVCDTLTFYGERAAQEAYLRTATERASLRAHARQIGYELRPAKAATVHLAFEVEAEADGEAPLEYEAGLQVRSIPRDGELPQIFETIEPLTAREQWTALTPRLHHPQVLNGNSDRLTLAPGGPPIRQGDPVIFLRGDTPERFNSDGSRGYLRRITNIEEAEDGTRQVTLAAKPASSPIYTFAIGYIGFFGWQSGQVLNSGSLLSNVAQKTWSLSALSTTTALNKIGPVNLAKAILALPKTLFDPILPARLGAVAGCFGNIANKEAIRASASRQHPGRITKTKKHIGDNTTLASNRAYVYLDREVPEIVTGSTVLLRDRTREGWSVVHGVEPVSVAAYALSAKVTRLEIDANLTGSQNDGSGGLQKVAASGFRTRTTTVYGAPEMLPLAELPITTDVGDGGSAPGADAIELSVPVLDLLPGKSVAIEGERADLPGVTAAEIRTIAETALTGGFTVLTFTQPLAHRYMRETVTLNGNVAEATHGETVAESLGDGDATKPFASFALKSGPLTHVSAATESGIAPALEIRVDGVRWDLVADFAGTGPEDRVYLLRIEEDGTARIVFGDGITGQRPSTGLGNIEAIYRKGAGVSGMLAAGQLALLATKPVGLKGVRNPLPSAAGDDAETLEDARTNAPLRVLTLGRVVSLHDYEDFARAFASVAKARADWAFDGFARPIFLTVAGPGGAVLPPDGADMQNLRARLAEAGEADQRVSVRNYTEARFHIAARLWQDPAYLPDDVKAAAEAALALAFGFEARALGQGVSHAQIIAVLQSVPGVRGVDLDALYRAGDPVALEPRLPAAVARPGQRGIPEPAELLLIDMAASSLEVLP